MRKKSIVSSVLSGTPTPSYDSDHTSVRISSVANDSRSRRETGSCLLFNRCWDELNWTWSQLKSKWTWPWTDYSESRYGLYITRNQFKGHLLPAPYEPRTTVSDFGLPHSYFYRQQSSWTLFIMNFFWLGFLSTCIGDDLPLWVDLHTRAICPFLRQAWQYASLKQHWFERWPVLSQP